MADRITSYNVCYTKLLRFVNRVWVRQRWLTLRREGLNAARLIEFHTAHKYLVMAHSQAAYQRLGRP